MSKREQILETAIRLFVNQGFENTPTSQIAKEADVATGTLFHHFETKQDLLNHAYLYVSKKAIDEMQDSKQPDFREYLREIWFSGLKWSLNHKDYIKFMFQYSHSTYIMPDTMRGAEENVQPFYKLITVGLTRDAVKPLPETLLINTYSNIFEVFFDYLSALESVDDKIIEDGFLVVWGALKKD